MNDETKHARDFLVMAGVIDDLIDVTTTGVGTEIEAIAEVANGAIEIVHGVTDVETNEILG